MTGAKYLDILTDRLIPELNQIYQNRFNKLWWIQDGTSAHGIKSSCAKISARCFLRYNYHTPSCNWMATENTWLKTLWLFPVGTLKIGEIYSSRKHRRVEREKILNEVNLQKANRPMVRRVIAGMRRKLQLLWVERNGRHVERNEPHLLWLTYLEIYIHVTENQPSNLLMSFLCCQLFFFWIYLTFFIVIISSDF